MKSGRTKLHIHAEGKISTGSGQAAASLHCHTHFSKEILTFIPYYASRVPVVADYFRGALANYQKVHGTELDFRTDRFSSTFVFNNPNQVSACGCGESVEIRPRSEGALAAS